MRRPWRSYVTQEYQSRGMLDHIPFRDIPFRDLKVTALCLPPHDNRFMRNMEVFAIQLVSYILS
jgi:hypothetical protein